MKNAGLVYAVLSSLFLSTGFVIAKHFLQYTNPETLNVLWFGIAFFVAAAFSLLRNRAETVALFKKNWKDGVIVGGANALAAAFWFQSISLAGPTATAFIIRFSTIFIIILGILFLKEKLRFHDIVGILIAIAGALTINFGNANGDYLKAGTLVALAASLAIAMHQVLSKVYANKLAPMVMVCVRSFYTFLFLLLYALVFSKLEPFPVSQLGLLSVGIIVNAVVGFVFFYRALDLMDVSKVAIIRTLDPFVVVIYALIAFHTLPSLYQLFGGTLVVLGVLVTMYGHALPTLLRTVKGLPWFG